MQQLPEYIKRRFRTKTFGLLSVQFAFTFVMMMVLEFALPWEKFGRTSLGTQGAFVGFGITTATLLCVLRAYAGSYPWNYTLLIIITLLVGGSWGLACSLLAGQLHFHIVGILTVAMPVATMCLAFPSSDKVEPERIVVTSVFLGWLTGSITDLIVLASMQEGSLSAVSVAVLFTAGLFGVVVYDVGNLLVAGNPDDFMRVVISMNSALLVVISIPIFALWFGCQHIVNVAESEAQEDDLAEAQRRANVTAHTIDP